VLKAGKFHASRCTLAMIAAAAMQMGLPSARAMTAEAAEQTQQAVARAVSLSASRPGGAVTVLRSPLPPNTRVHLVSRQSAPGSRSLLLRLACDDSRDCLPFYAVIEGTTLASAPQAVSFAPPSFAPAANHCCVPEIGSKLLSSFQDCICGREGSVCSRAQSVAGFASGR
jgi:hypothetical protein